MSPQNIPLQREREKKRNRYRRVCEIVEKTKLTCNERAEQRGPGTGVGNCRQRSSGELTGDRKLPHRDCGSEGAYVQ